MIPRFKKSRFEPKPIETDYWIDLNENEYGGVFKYYDNNAMVWKQTEAITKEREPQFTNSPAYKITTNDINYWNNKVGIEDFDALKEEVLDLGSKCEGVTLEMLQYYLDLMQAEIESQFNTKADKNSVYTKKEVDTKFDEWKVDLPENVSYFKNDAGYVTEENLAEKLPENIVSDANYVHTDNNYTTSEKDKLSTLFNYDDTKIVEDIENSIIRITKAEEDINTVSTELSKEIAKKANLDEVYTRTYLDEVFKQFVKKTHKTYGFIDERPTSELNVEDTGFVFYDYTVNEPLIWVSDSWRLLRTNEEFAGYLLPEDISTPTGSAGNWDYATLSDDFVRLNRYTGEYVSTLNINVPNLYNNRFVLQLGNENDKRLNPKVLDIPTGATYSITPPDGRPSANHTHYYITSVPEKRKAYLKAEHVDKYSDLDLYDVFGNKVATAYNGTSEYPARPYIFGTTNVAVNSINLPQGIKHINDGAFTNIVASTNTDIKIPNGTQTIGIGAFRNSGITSVEFPSNPMTFGLQAFSNNPLTNVTIPKTLDWDDIINGGAYGLFAACTGPALELNIEEGVKALPESIFNSTLVNSVKFPKSLEYIGASAFYDSQVKGDFDSAGIKTIGSFAFRNAQFNSIVFQNNIEYIAPNAFQWAKTSPRNTCTRLVLSPNLKEVYAGSIPTMLGNCAADIVTPPNLKALPIQAFYYYGYDVNNIDNVTPIIDINLTISEGIEYIGTNAFTYSNFTNNLVLPESLKYISSCAFTKMSKQKLEKLRLGKNVRVIGGIYSAGPGNEIGYYAIQKGLIDKFYPKTLRRYGQA